MDYPPPRLVDPWEDEAEEERWYGPWEEPIHPWFHRRKRRKRGRKEKPREARPDQEGDRAEYPKEEPPEAGLWVLLIPVAIWVILYLVLRNLAGGK